MSNLYYNNENFYIVENSAFPNTIYFKIPFEGNLSREQVCFNNILTKQRIIVESKFGIFKGRFKKFRS